MRKPFRCFNDLVDDVIYRVYNIYDFECRDSWHMELEHCIVPLLPSEWVEWNRETFQCEGFVMFSKNKVHPMIPSYYWRTQQFCFCKIYNKIKKGIDNYECNACTCRSDEEDECLPEDVMGPMCECIKSRDIIVDNVDECMEHFRYNFSLEVRPPAAAENSSNDSAYVSESD